MRIGVIGWYGHRNPGDERILECLRQLFDGEQLAPTSSFEDAIARLDELNRCDYVLFGGGGLVLRGTGRYAELFERIEVPFSAIGLGVEYRDPTNQRLLDVLCERAELIHVRDAASRERLDRHPKVIAGADLTFLFPYEIADWTMEDRCALNLRAWVPADPAPPRGGWLRRLVDLTSRESAHAWDPAASVREVQRRFTQIEPLPFYDEPGETSDAQELAAQLGSCAPGFDLQSIARSRYLVAMRLHALIFACQMAIPFVSLSYQPKNRALCADLGLEWASVPLGDTARLAEALDTLCECADEHRTALVELRESQIQRCRKSVEPVVAAVREHSTDRKSE
jgi:polysaccharide pyruvyl transferase WcaK-like protein